VSAGRADGVGRRHDAWARHVTLLDRLLQRHVVVVRRSDVANRGEASLEGLLRVRHAYDRPEVVGEFQLPVAAEPGIARQVHVHIDQTGQ
jgi:hypothetical protein